MSTRPHPVHVVLFIYLFIYFSESTVFEFSTLEALPHYKKAAMLIALMNFQKVRNE